MLEARCLCTGFHSETEEEFQDTLSLMREAAFDSSFLFKYSERPGTFASQHLPDDIPEEVKIDRLNRMIALQNELSLENNLKDVGTETGRASRSARKATVSDLSASKKAHTLPGMGEDTRQGRPSSTART